MAVFDIVLRNLALVDLLLFGQKIRGKALLATFDNFDTVSNGFIGFHRVSFGLKPWL